MRCLQFNGAGKPLTIEIVPDPEPAAHEIVIKVARCGICGSDVSMTDPRSPVVFADGARLGHEYAGEVVAIGRDVTGFSVGDRVTALPTQGCGTCTACRAGDPNGCSGCHHVMGGYGEYTRADARLAIRLPETLSLTDGALVEPLACGGQAARLAGIGSGARVLVLGAGPIGLASIFAARRAGAARIAAAARSDRARALAEAIGADAFFEGVASPEELAARLGGAPDVVIECTGAPGRIGTAIDLVASRGTVVNAGLCFDAQTIGFGAAIGKQITLRFSLAYTLADFRRAVDALAAGHVEPRAMIGETIALADLPGTIEMLRGRRSDHKLMVDPWRMAPKETSTR
ncbi:zinc-dependent alcohol dehydrogenase [Flavisphingomonas formosensis]|uniref:zinc-dependent alcohol dehydrogenase n=1 Tax=Flavisphingomonas formosensis TaxID=861534 RepID=UPI0012F9E65A|nr:alcohol dehydrogenase catalytic domain-containing protein [Sphingomonas formosensis]